MKLNWTFLTPLVASLTIAEPPTDDQVIPLVILSGPQYADFQHRCIQDLAPHPLMENVTFPAWVGGQYKDLGFVVYCSKVESQLAFAPRGTSPELLAKFFVVTYTSQVGIRDWTNFDKSEEGMRVVERYWQTGEFLDDRDRPEPIVGTESVEGTHDSQPR